MRERAPVTASVLLLLLLRTKEWKNLKCSFVVWMFKHKFNQLSDSECGFVSIVNSFGYCLFIALSIESCRPNAVRSMITRYFQESYFHRTFFQTIFFSSLSTNSFISKNQRAFNNHYQISFSLSNYSIVESKKKKIDSVVWNNHRPKPDSIRIIKISVFHFSNFIVAFDWINV